jgi:hypothetical protein
VSTRKSSSREALVITTRKEEEAHGCKEAKDSVDWLEFRGVLALILVVEEARM